MNLHRAESKPDWELVPHNERNPWQKIAAKTKGIATPGNALSLAGAAITAWGLNDIKNDRMVSGTLKVGFGRVLDMADGGVADGTGTKSPTGEAVDSGLDKLLAFSALIALSSKNIIPQDQAITAGVQNGANMAAGGIAKFRDKESHPTRGGKDSTMAFWMSVGSRCIARTAQQYSFDKTEAGFNTAANVFYETYRGLGLRATEQYFRQVLD